ncbi:MAG: hypothetical protein EBU90_31375, partial [Proteobacteria bacterium]|nr:hypothetical protein [Pseudomonadota bacterium]
SLEFEAWFIRTRFSEMEQVTRDNLVLLERKFRNQQYRFNWKIEKRPWYKVFSKTLGMTSGDTIVTYEQVFNKMSAAEKAAHFAHEMMHVMGFTHSEKPSKSRDKSLPYQVGEYVYAVTAHYKKANE